MTAGRHGVVLSGGASYGAYEIGVLKALATGELPGGHFLDPQVIAGTSAGAFNAAVLVGHSSAGLATAVSRLEDVWRSQIAESPDKCEGSVIRYRVNPLTLVNRACLEEGPAAPVRRFVSDANFVVADSVRRALHFARGRSQVGQRILNLVNLETVISGEPYRRLVAANVPLPAVRAAPVQLRIAATNWNTGEVRVFGNAEMTDRDGHSIILASSAIPGVLPTVEIDGVSYADGGLVMNTPMRPAVEAGADTIHVVSVNPQVHLMRLPPVSGTVGEVYRTLAISLASAINRDIEIASRINEGIRILEGAKKGVYDPNSSLHNLVLTLGGFAGRPIPYRQLTVHRYQLADPAESFLSWLDFGDERVRHLIQTGYDDTVNHDCRLSGCVLPL